MQPSAAALLPASIPSPSQSVWYLGPFPVRAYALCLLAGIFVAVWWAHRRYRARGGDEDTTYDIAILAVPAGILGARVYHVLSSPDAYFGPNGDLALIPQIWRGGLGVWGAMPAGIAVGAWMLHRRGLRLAPFADAVAPTFLVAQAIGRLGNWFNQELFGAPTTLPWGLEIDDAHLPDGFASGTLFHPTFLYEALWNLAGAALLLWLERRLRGRDGAVGGRLIWAYVMVYACGRVWIEHLRIDEAEHLLGLRLNVWTSIVVGLIGLVGYVIASRRSHSDAIARDGEGREQAPEADPQAPEADQQASEHADA